MLFFAVLALACLTGCGKKETAAQPPASENAQTQSVASPTAPAQQQGAAAVPPANAPRPETYDATLTVRSIDSLRTLIVRKDWSYARQTLRQVEARPLTPEQRQYVDKLKAQIPAH
jgi:predicted small lipoprotein YifL